VFGCLFYTNFAAAVETITVTGKRPGQVPDRIVAPPSGGSPDGGDWEYGGGGGDFGSGSVETSKVPLPKPWPKTLCKATISCWSETSIGHECEVANLYLTADEAYQKLQQINCCANTAGGGRPNGYKQWKGCSVF